MTEQASGLRPSVVALLSRIVDYAGLFPPAKLGMAETVANYARYVEGEDAWMLGRLIAPIARLQELETHAREHLPQDAGAEPWHLSGLVAPAGSGGLHDDLDRIAAFNARHAEPGAGLARIDVIELAAGSAAAIEEALDAIPDELFPFFELPLAHDPRGLIATVVGSDAGAKVRTGGVTPDLYPSPVNLGRFIAGCAAARVPMKATAGLHHPLRHRAAGLDTLEFGFLNVFIAAALAYHAGLDGPPLVEVLEEQEAEAFRVDDEEIAWRDHALGIEEIAEARARFAVSFGSCSFDEPRDDLRELGLL